MADIEFEPGFETLASSGMPKLLMTVNQAKAAIDALPPDIGEQLHWKMARASLSHAEGLGTVEAVWHAQDLIANALMMDGYLKGRRYK